jgi:hypothetical protein
MLSVIILNVIMLRPNMLSVLGARMGMWACVSKMRSDIPTSKTHFKIGRVNEA